MSLAQHVHEEEAPEEAEEEEVVDPKPEVEDSCKPRCVKQLLSYEACVKRVDDEEEAGQKHCTGQYFDYWGCIDQCGADKLKCNLSLHHEGDGPTLCLCSDKAAPKIFRKLK